MTDKLASVDGQLREAALEALSYSDRTVSAGDPTLARLTSLGTRLWLDTGRLEEAAPLWTPEFSALTTNNTLANQVVQTGALDTAASEAARRIKDSQPGISDADLVMELGFVVNCHVALRLVRAFDAFVSLELHPSVSTDIERTVDYARRYHAICPERFIIKVPLTPEGYCAIGRLSADGIPINYTLGFSARQNYIAALMSKPAYVNVFLGRLNAVVADNGIGDGVNVGERVTIATQWALRELRREGRSQTLLIAASMRSASQMLDLAGVDVYTIPPKVVTEFLKSGAGPEAIVSRLDTDYPVTLADSAVEEYVRPLWEITDEVRVLGEAVEGRGASMTGEELRQADADTRAGMFRRYTDAEKTMIRTDGKIPRIAHWDGCRAPLDDLMAQSALQSFTVDQGELDARLMRIAR